MVLFTCSHKGCKKSFNSRFSMKRHQLIHQPDKPYACVYCPKRFLLKQYLCEHTSIHTGAKPFRCSYPSCGKTFRQAGKLSLHKKQHQSQANYREYTERIILNYQLPDWFDTKTLPYPISSAVHNNA
jgi:uncharacterized Zn-finger protein